MSLSTTFSAVHHPSNRWSLPLLPRFHSHAVPPSLRKRPAHVADIQGYRTTAKLTVYDKVRFPVISAVFMALKCIFARSGRLVRADDAEGEALHGRIRSSPVSAVLSSEFEFLCRSLLSPPASRRPLPSGLPSNTHDRVKTINDTQSEKLHHSSLETPPSTPDIIKWHTTASHLAFPPSPCRPLLETTVRM